VTGTVAGLRWRVEGTGPCVVLVHGWALTLDYFAAAAPLLAQRFRVLRFDRSGFGQSRGRPSLAADVDDLFALLDEMGEHSAVLVGMSQGARVVIAAALAHASRVRAVVLDGPPALAASSDAMEVELPLDELRKVLAKEGVAALQARLRQHALFQLISSRVERRALLDDMLRRYVGADLEAGVDQALRCDPAALRQPCFIINGAADSAARLSAGASLAQAIHGCSRVVLPGAGHLAALDAPEDYVREVAQFIVAREAVAWQSSARRS
jgi:3-oxoadipate enol-lactonase